MAPPMITLQQVRALAARGLFPFAECPHHGLVLVSVQYLHDGRRLTCGDCGGVTGAALRFLDRDAARQRGWHISVDDTVQRP